MSHEDVALYLDASCKHCVSRNSSD